MNNQEETFASGDAFCTQLLLSPSLSDLLPQPDVLQEHGDGNENFWRYKETLTASDQQAGEGQGCTPRLIPIGSLKKTVYHYSSKRQGKMNSIKSPKKEKIVDRNNKNPKGSHSNECFIPQESQPALNYVIMARLFLCQSCHMSPMTSMTVHMCKHGHQVCGNCFNHSELCAICREPLEGRNHPVEAALQKLKVLRPELFFQEFLIPSKPDDLGETHCKAMHQSSHKPVHCPHLSCHSTVAYNGFLQHFKFEHSAVPIVNTMPKCSHHFPLQESLLTHSFARVLTVFKVNLVKSKKFNGDPVICCLSSIPVHIGGVKSLAAWCSSMYNDGTPSPLTYTIGCPNPRRSIAYRGPTASLQENTSSIVLDGRCIIVPPELLENFPLQNESPSTLQVEFLING